ncbi:unnamed protein product [Vicia faba]|uniref:Uncharacterized protein n=1 Tax=Vicia faba TaxID=3906 RepID=A0AAV1ADS1_VICFA|nr:unnamed protein product [Vicia faba]
MLHSQHLQPLFCFKLSRFHLISDSTFRFACLKQLREFVIAHHFQILYLTFSRTISYYGDSKCERERDLELYLSEKFRGLFKVRDLETNILMLSFYVISLVHVMEQVKMKAQLLKIEVDEGCCSNEVKEKEHYLAYCFTEKIF